MSYDRAHTHAGVRAQSATAQAGPRAASVTPSQQLGNLGAYVMAAHRLVRTQVIADSVRLRDLIELDVGLNARYNEGFYQGYSGSHTAQSLRLAAESAEYASNLEKAFAMGVADGINHRLSEDSAPAAMKSPEARMLREVIFGDKPILQPIGDTYWGELGPQTIAPEVVESGPWLLNPLAAKILRFLFRTGYDINLDPQAVAIFLVDEGDLPVIASDGSRAPAAAVRARVIRINRAVWRSRETSPEGRLRNLDLLAHELTHVAHFKAQSWWDHTTQKYQKEYDEQAARPDNYIVPDELLKKTPFEHFNILDPRYTQDQIAHWTSSQLWKMLGWD